MAKKRRIGVVDLVTKAPTKALWARVMHPSLASIMPQTIAVWCEELGHDVSFVCYTGFENLLEELPADLDMLFIGAFTQAAQLSYAMSNMFQQRGAVTVLGGPHARCYPEDSSKYFDYVLGFTDKNLLKDVIDECEPQRPQGVYLTAPKHPLEMPGVIQRWKFIEPTLAKCPTKIKIVPMIGSLGCPYTCSFCIDSTVDYQPMSYDQIREDLRFVTTKFKEPIIGWHDPNFGVRFEDFLGAIEDSVPAGKISHVAEMSLSLLSEPKLKRMRAAGFKAMLPGIESWYSLGNKAKTGKAQGMDKVKSVSDQVNMILRYIPYVQTNFVLGLDDDAGAEPFELTKRFLDMTPGAFPAYSLWTAFGEAAPLNLELQQADRVLPFPFHFMNNNHAMNVIPKHYEWRDFYDKLIDVSKYSFGWPRIIKRARGTPLGFGTWLNAIRSLSSEGAGRIKYHTMIRGLLDSDSTMLPFFNGETTKLPDFYTNRMKNDLGDFWDYLPAGSVNHDPHAYMNKQNTSAPIELKRARAAN